MRMALIWSDLVRPSPHGPAVFEVLPEYRRPVRDWAVARAAATAAHRDVHAPVVEGWAVLDGGVTAVSGYDLTSLPHGLRVIGFRALRLLLADLGAAAPDPFPDEVLVAPDEPERGGAPEAVEQAELLAVCRDAVLLRWVARTLLDVHHTGSGQAAGADPAEEWAARRSAR